MKVEFFNVTKEFKIDKDNSHIIFKDFNFKLKENDITLIYGENGSGKSTFALLLTAFIKPTNGYIKFDDFVFDNKTKKRKLKEIRNKVKIVFQDINLQIFKSTVRDEIAFSFSEYFRKEKKTQEEKKDFIDEKVDYLFKILNFPREYESRSPYKLSGGERKKLIVGCLLLTPTEILILDEPTAGLDAPTKKEFINFIRELNEKFKTTILIITHDLKFKDSFSNHFEIEKLKKGII